MNNMEYQAIEAASEFNLFDLFAKCQNVAVKRVANDDECRAYAKWLAMKNGVVEAVTEKPKLEWKNFDRRGNDRVCIGAYFGAAFVPFPGADQNGAVTFELLDENGNVETSGTIYAKQNGALNIAAADVAAMKESAKAWTKANKAKGKPAPVVTPISEAERTANSIALGEQMAAAMNEYRQANPLPPIEQPATVEALSDELDAPAQKDDGGFRKRVDYAVAVISARRETSRAFDSCFENYDGDAVVYSLIKRAKKNEKLAANLPHYICATSLAELDGRFDGQDIVEVARGMQQRAYMGPTDEPTPPESATHAPQDDAQATHVANQPEIAPQDEKNSLADDIEAQPDAIAALVARIDALELAMLNIAATNEGAEINNPSGAIETDAPLSEQPKRTAAHIRAIMAYLAMRALRGELASERKHNAIGMEQIDAMRENLAFAISERDAAHTHITRVEGYMRDAENRADEWESLQHRTWEQSMGYKMKRRRAVLKARDFQQRLYAEHKIVDKQLAAKRELVQDIFQIAEKEKAAVAESERLRKVAYQQAGHIQTVAERLDRAEAILRAQGPALSIVPPISLAVAA